ncbi:MAG: DUF4856 domain-containing protein [Bacteroidia bacterium]|nr:DUF4856 domain-containing protein [Bacteroidia bacterium]
MYLKTKITSVLIALTLLVSVQSCKDDDVVPTPDNNTYSVPTTYNFTNVSYSGQTQRIGQLTELKTYLKTANISGTSLDEEKLLAMFSNDATKAGWSGTYEDSKQIKNKTFEAVQTVFEQLLKNIAASSMSTVAGSDGTAGVVPSNDNSKAYLLNDKGVEEGQVIEKGLMGAFIYYQICEIYTGSGKMDVDNETVTEGKGTAMEHHWDEAFGYFGVPLDFPTTTDNLAFIGSYCNKRDGVLKCNAPIMNAFLKGRAAISNKDMTGRDEAIAEVRKQLEKVPAGSAIHYLNSAMENFDDMALRAHALSEAIGFIYGLQFNPNRSATTVQIGEVLTKIGGDVDITKMNLYNTTKANIEAARDQLADLMSMTEVKTEL